MHFRRKTVFTAAFTAVLMVASGLTPAWAMPPTTASALNTAFNTYGDTAGRWAGGDSTASVTLPDGRVVWLFSDTFIGAVNADHSLAGGAVMVNNSAVVQSASGQLVSTLTGGTTQSPSALVATGVTDDFYWVADGTATGTHLQVLFNRYHKTGPEPLDVAIIDTALATFALPSLTLNGVTDLGLGNEIAWGSALFDDGGYTYIYGSELGNGAGPSFAHVARVPVGGLSAPWQFWNGSTWSSNKDATARLLSGVGTAFGVQKMGSQYVLVTVEGHLPFNPETVAYTSASPTGPFTGPVSLFVAPDSTNDPDSSIIAYDARVHPEFAPSGKLLVSYNVNSLEPGLSNADIRRYRPRFVEVAWPVPAPGPGVPPAPTGLTATPNTDGGIHLAWQGSAPGYAVYMRDVTGDWTHFARMSLASAQTFADPTLLRDGHTYEFKVSAVNATGEGPASAVVSATASVAPTPPVTGVAVTAHIDGRATVSWTAVTGAWNYRVFMRDVTAGATDFIKVKSVGSDRTSAVIEWLEDNHEYELYVVTANGAGSSPPSALVRVTSHHAAPAAPTGLTAMSNVDGTIAISWTAPGPDLWYWVYQRDITVGETTFARLPLPISGTTMTAGYLIHAHEYEYQVTATNRIGEGPSSATARATANYPPPAAPSALTATLGDGQVVLSWTASATPDAWYLVYQRDVTAGETAFTQLPYPVTSCCTMTAGYLANGHTYEFKVAATKAGRTSGDSNVVSATPHVAPPGQVTGLTATALGDGSVTLSWTAPGSNLWFNVYQRDVTAGESTFTQLGLPVTSCCTANIGKDFNLNNHLYEYRVAATNSGGEGTLSATAQATAHYDPPPAPTNLRGVSSGDGYIQLDWDYPSQTYFWVYYRDVTAGATTFTRSVYPAGAPRVTWGPLPNGHVFEFKVTATNAGGEGAASNTIQVTATGGLPLAPSNLNASPGDGQVVLTWTASATANVWYLVYQRDVTTNQSWQKLPLPITSCCTMTAGYLANGHTYEFKVTATNASGDSGPSNVVSARPMPPIPQPPTGLNATAGNGQVTLTWTASTTSPVYYWVEQRVSGGTWTRLSLPVTTCCTATLGYLTNFTTYEFRLLSNNLAGDSTTPSNTASARPVPPVPAAPTNLTASPSNGNVQLHWTASTTPNVYYWIEWKRSDAGSWTRAAYPLTSCCDFTAGYLINGVNYQFRVIATNGYESAPSNVATAKPWVPMTQAPALSGFTLGEHAEFLWWTPVANASGYWIEYQDLTRHGPWTRMQYPTTDTAFAPQYLSGARWYRWHVVPFNGEQEGPASSAIDIRTAGRAIYEARDVLGDSYSAGIGAGDEFPGCVGGGYGDPYRGPWAWGMMLPVWSTTIRELSCNGALIKDVHDNQMNNMFRPNDATLITMTIGGNDAKFTKNLQECAEWNFYWLSKGIFWMDCTSKRATFEADIRARKPELVLLYRRLLTENTGADIIVAGYPKILVAPGTGKCDAGIAQAFADADHTMIRELAGIMNQMIEEAADEVGIMNAVDETLAEFEGHEACANDEYINQGNYQASGQLLARSSFHPKYSGQQAYVRAVMNALRYNESTGGVRRVVL